MREGKRRLFIYYRLDPAALPAACQAVRQAQQALQAAHPGLVAGLLQRPTPPTGPGTLMETYAMDARIDAGGVNAGVEAAIHDALCAALAPWVRAADRHLEVFTDPDFPCAS